MKVDLIHYSILVSTLPYLVIYMTASKWYFKGLHGLRFMAAFLVFIFHAELIRSTYGIFHLNGITLFSSGSLAVEFFFVLSGFLISFLLLREQEELGDINIRQFYFRRMIRIWPLYYLVLLLGLFLVPAILKLLGIGFDSPYPIGAGGLLFAFFLPNLAVSIWGFSFLGPLWSIGVEEQFYLIWAPVMKFCRRYIGWVFVSVILIRLLFYACYDHFLAAGEGWTIFAGFLKTLKFESMSIGALGAWLYYKYRHRLLHLKIFRMDLQVFLLAIIVVRFTFHRSIVAEAGVLPSIYKILFDSFYSFLFIDFLFLWLILNVSCNPRSIISTEGRLFNFLGRISYGIYMYHTMVLLIVIKLLKGCLMELSPLLSTLVLYTVAGGVTVLVSWLSYRYFEMKFLLLKMRGLNPAGQMYACGR